MKIPFEPEFGESVIVVLRTTVNDVVSYPDGSVLVMTNDGSFSTDDSSLVAVFPDPSED